MTDHATATTATTATPEDLATMRARLAAAETAAASHADQAAADAREREVTFRRQRLATYDRATYSRALRDAERALWQAVDSDPVTNALIERHAAQWRAHVASQNAYDDACIVARADGTQPPSNPGSSDPANNIEDQLWRVVSNVAADRLQLWREQRDEALSEAMHGSTEAHVVETGEQLLETARRREAAQHLSRYSVDVTGLSDRARAAQGLTTGSTREPGH